MEHSQLIGGDFREEIFRFAGGLVGFPFPDRAAQVELDEINAFIREFYDPENFAMLKVSPP